MTEWVTEWVSEIVTTREAIASNKIIFSICFLFCRVRSDLLRGHFQQFQLLLWLKSQQFQLLLWLKFLCYVYRMFGLRYLWPNVARVTLSWIFAKTWLSDWLTEWLSDWVSEIVTTREAIASKNGISIVIGKMIARNNYILNDIVKSRANIILTLS